ncbi:hypothetical protein F5B18DRAFT_470476 [Nemania serpens]|nr:hypothetical protein F5B18DRAFT_470476 [Nemania serpens]
MLFLRPFTQAWIGIHILFSLFSGISVRDLYFAPSRLGSEYSLGTPSAQIWSLIFEGKGIIIITCALRPFILDRNYATGNIDSPVSCHKANSVIPYRMAPIPTTTGIEQELVRDHRPST